jgi:dTDP-glucose 4,6-dehydratase
VHGRSCYPYNVGSPQDLSVSELAQSVTRIVAPGARIEFAGTPKSGVPPSRYVPSTTRAEEELGLRSTVSMADGIRRTADWHRHSERENLVPLC